MLNPTTRRLFFILTLIFNKDTQTTTSFTTIASTTFTTSSSPKRTTTTTSVHAATITTSTTTDNNSAVENNDDDDISSYHNDPTCLSRGGSLLSESEFIISDFLSTIPLHQQNQKKYANAAMSPNFCIHGWRWHTMSTIRDFRRLERLARSKDDVKAGAEFVVEFNMKGLHTIENDLFMPWVRQMLIGEEKVVVKDGEVEVRLGDEVKRALEVVLRDMDEERGEISKLGQVLLKQTKTLTTSSSSTKIEQTMTKIADMSSDLSTRIDNLMKRQHQYVLPLISTFISSKKQESFNDGVLWKLGLLTSRVHLVGMYDAVSELEGNVKKEEMILFEKYIPYVARIMIPRWKRLLYEPKAGVLDGLSES